ncbi:MAG TPA: DnaJ domain-containing protein [Chlamydiales bacterium]|nr:MAG: hypothetical protein A3F67_08480 [Verrucomicrobia bacterium RIFCSPHIGHO2_12_FULL_41_10]HLB52211.1 DnaJ domain-containing protein [Chlamydiales bacterium]
MNPIALFTTPKEAALCLHELNLTFLDELEETALFLTEENGELEREIEKELARRDLEKRAFLIEKKLLEEAITQVGRTQNVRGIKERLKVRFFEAMETLPEGFAREKMSLFPDAKISSIPSHYWALPLKELLQNLLNDDFYAGRALQVEIAKEELCAFSFSERGKKAFPKAPLSLARALFLERMQCGEISVTLKLHAKKEGELFLLEGDECITGELFWFFLKKEATAPTPLWKLRLEFPFSDFPLSTMEGWEKKDLLLTLASHWIEESSIVISSEQFESSNLDAHVQLVLQTFGFTSEKNGYDEMPIEMSLRLESKSLDQRIEAAEKEGEQLHVKRREEIHQLQLLLKKQQLQNSLDLKSQMEAPAYRDQLAYFCNGPLKVKRPVDEKAWSSFRGKFQWRGVLGPDTERAKEYLCSKKLCPPDVDMRQFLERERLKGHFAFLTDKEIRSFPKEKPPESASFDEQVGYNRAVRNFFRDNSYAIRFILPLENGPITETLVLASLLERHYAGRLVATASFQEGFLEKNEQIVTVRWYLVNPRSYAEKEFFETRGYMPSDLIQEERWALSFSCTGMPDTPTFLLEYEKCPLEKGGAWIDAESSDQKLSGTEFLLEKMKESWVKRKLIFLEEKAPHELDAFLARRVAKMQATPLKKSARYEEEASKSRAFEPLHFIENEEEKAFLQGLQEEVRSKRERLLEIRQRNGEEERKIEDKKEFLQRRIAWEALYSPGRIDRKQLLSYQGSKFVTTFKHLEGEKFKDIDYSYYPASRREKKDAASEERKKALYVLGLEDEATFIEIKKAYRTLSLVHHPDKGGKAHLFDQIARAYETLCKEEENFLLDVHDMDGTFTLVNKRLKTLRNDPLFSEEEISQKIEELAHFVEELSGLDFQKIEDPLLRLFLEKDVKSVKTLYRYYAISLELLQMKYPPGKIALNQIDFLQESIEKIDLFRKEATTLFWTRKSMNFFNHLVLTLHHKTVSFTRTLFQLLIGNDQVERAKESWTRAVKMSTFDPMKKMEAEVLSQGKEFQRQVDAIKKKLGIKEEVYEKHIREEKISLDEKEVVHTYKQALFSGLEKPDRQHQEDLNAAADALSQEESKKTLFAIAQLLEHEEISLELKRAIERLQEIDVNGFEEAKKIDRVAAKIAAQQHREKKEVLQDLLYTFLKREKVEPPPNVEESTPIGLQIKRLYEEIDKQYAFFNEIEVTWLRLQE